MEPAYIEMLEAAIEQNGCCSMVVGGRSMLPVIHDNDVLIISGLHGNPVVGMIVAFRAGMENSPIIVHRCVWRRKHGNNRWNMWVLGDSSPGSLCRISSDEILGVVTAIKRGNKIRRIRLNPLSRLSGMAGASGSHLVFTFRHKARSFLNRLLKKRNNLPA